MTLSLTGDSCTLERSGSYFLPKMDTYTADPVWCQSSLHFTTPPTYNTHNIPFGQHNKTFKIIVKSVMMLLPYVSRSVLLPRLLTNGLFTPALCSTVSNFTSVCCKGRFSRNGFQRPLNSHNMFEGRFTFAIHCQGHFTTTDKLLKYVSKAALPSQKH